MRVLVVDDHNDSRDLYTEYLGHAGWDARAVSNGEEALEAAASFAPAIIVMDLEMPVLDGVEATRRLKRSAKTRHIPILVLTSSEDKADEAVTAGCDEFLTKPCLPQNLIAVIEQMLAPPDGRAAKREGSA